ncbi:PLP-dependent transferase [Trichoderma citrinoviride]|uniref:PLP-dependent transferase n=1 Tax=Trichoderma citrinoviride TaxID=58853 RepID=A0A2T4BCA0_9HYPO|nr:PLP-dependent transferase [Trichoderma citrinoviride]PTB66861.1 PLP-dependent transferase [Trichoderma citrinoviride]
MALSSRASKLKTPDPSFSILTNSWHPSLNPSGYVNLAVAENYLMHAALQSHLHAHLHVPTTAFTYGDFFKRSRGAIARFLTKHLRAASPIETGHVAVASGCTAAVEHLAWAFADPGDLILLGRPYYGAFPWDATLRTGARLAYVDFGEDDPLGDVCVQKYEDRILEAHSNGEKVTALLLCHPHNPLGRCYPRHVLVDLLKLCDKYKLHLISDEIYALSIFDNTVDAEPAPAPFHSVLSIDPTGVIDPAYVHVIWGMSKDFGANGLRLGAIISQHNVDLMTALVPVVLLTSVSSLTEHVLANVLEDDAWVEHYIKENQRKLSTYYEYITAWAKSNDIVYAPGVNAGFFIWADLGRTYLKHQTDNKPEADVDQAVMDALLRHKVFLASGLRFGSEKLGWFRIVFSHDKEYLDEGLRRIVAAVTTPGPSKEVPIDLENGLATAEGV